MQRRAEENWKPGSRFEARAAQEEIRHLRTGWLVGSEAFRDRMSDLVAGILKGRKRASYTGEEVRGHDESEAQRIVERGLDALGMELPKLRPLRQNDPRKQALAWLIRTRTIVADDWITQHLDMGHRSNVSRAVGAFRSARDAQRRRLKRTLHKCAD
jgi:hypothetical protein